MKGWIAVAGKSSVESLCCHQMEQWICLEEFSRTTARVASKVICHLYTSVYIYTA